MEVQSIITDTKHLNFCHIYSRATSLTNIDTPYRHHIIVLEITGSYHWKYATIYPQLINHHISSWKQWITAIPKKWFTSTDFNKHKLDSSLTQTTRIGVFLPVNVHVYTYLHYNHLRDYIYRQNPIFLLQYMHFFFHCSVT